MNEKKFNSINLKINPKTTEAKIINFIKNKTKNFDGAVIGISGGIDSAVCAYLSAKAIGSKKTFGLILPSKSTNKNNIDDAKKIPENLGIKYNIVEINDVLNQIKKISFSKDKIGLGNIASRIRMILLRDFAHKNNLLVVGTGNKSELTIGYFTKNGDGGVDILPIGGLYKTQVIQMAKYLKIEKKIIEKKPSADLWENQTDENEIGMSYEMLDKILILKKGFSNKQISKTLFVEQKIINDIEQRIKKNKHKIEPIPVLEI